MEIPTTKEVTSCISQLPVETAETSPGEAKRPTTSISTAPYMVCRKTAPRMGSANRTKAGSMGAVTKGMTSCFVDAIFCSSVLSPLFSGILSPFLERCLLFSAMPRSSNRYPYQKLYAYSNKKPDKLQAFQPVSYPALISVE